MNTDPISDFLTRIRNAQRAKKKTVDIPSSNLKLKIAEIMKSNCFISDYTLNETENKQGNINIKLKYYNNQGVILGLERASRPGIRKYVRFQKIPKVLNGLGIAVVSTSKGVMTDKEARTLGVGGEVVCNIW
jgi:small subunit ribosomal protein S8